MTSKGQALKSKLSIFKAITKDEIKIPAMPMDAYVQESNNLYHWSQPDKPILSNAGLALDLLEDLPVRSDAASEAQSLWSNVMASTKEAQKKWNTESPEAYDLRDEIIHYMRYAYRNDSNLLTRVSSVAEGNSDADMIQDLNNLYVIGTENMAPLVAIGFDPAKLESAAEQSKQMGLLKAASTTDKTSDQEKKLQRDRAYTHLKEAVDAIRECGQFAFWKDEDRRKGYASAYNRKKTNTTTK